MNRGTADRAEPTRRRPRTHHTGHPDHRAARQRRANRGDGAARRGCRRRRPTHRRGPGAPDARHPRPPVSARRVRHPAQAHLVLPVARDPPALRQRRDRSGAGSLLRGVRADADAHRRPAGDRRRVATRPPRLLLARRVGRLHLELHRPRPLLPRGHRRHAPHVRPQPDPRVTGGRLVPQRSPARRGPPGQPPATPTGASPNSSPNGSPTAPRSRPASARSRTRSWRR